MAPAKKGPSSQSQGTCRQRAHKGKSMTRTVRLSSIVVALLLALPLVAHAQKKHPKGAAEPAPASGGQAEKLKFSPDPVGKGAPPAATGPASKTLERALKLYE